MHLNLSLTSEDYEQFTEKIISKYRSINRPNINKNKAKEYDKQIQDFAQSLCGMYQKLYPLFLTTHYQYGTYLALINDSPSNRTNFHRERKDEDFKRYREFDNTHWVHEASTTFDALLVNFRKLIIDTSERKSKAISEAKSKAISMTRISQKIEQLHTNIKANDKEYTDFVEVLNKQIEIATAPERKGLWNYIHSHVLHLGENYSIDTEDQFNIHDLEILLNSVRKFINHIYDFYNYKEPTYIAYTGYDKTIRRIEAFSTFQKHSMRILNEHITALAQLSNTPEYMDLTSKEASEAIFKKEILEKVGEHNISKIIIEGYIEKRIEALRKEIISDHSD